MKNKQASEGNKLQILFCSLGVPAIIPEACVSACIRGWLAELQIACQQLHVLPSDMMHPSGSWGEARTDYNHTAILQEDLRTLTGPLTSAPL